MERERRGTRERSEKSGLSAAFLQALDDYRVRMLIACCSALLMTIGILQLPADFIDKRIGFRSGSSSADFFRLDVQRTPRVAREANHRQKGTHPMAERASSLEAIPPLERHRNEDGDGDGEPGDRRQRERPLNRLDTHNMLTIADDQPRFVGGIGRYYLNIDYPDEAREAGVQGRLVLRFTVGVDGLAHDIVVEESLHPLCDSSAVAALERSHFIPGQVDGERVPIRLRLPVRFQLVEVASNQLLTESK